MIVAKLILRLFVRTALLILFGWLLDRWFHTGWFVGICLTSVMDYELDSIARRVAKENR